MYLVESNNFNIKSIWECQFDRMIQYDPELAEFSRTLDIVTPLQLRDGLTGGRTCPIKLFHDCKIGEKIRYLDVCSLYPYVNLTCKYPTCHPIIITNQDEMDTTLESYFGIVKLKVLPPKNEFWNGITHVILVCCKRTENL